MVIFADRDHHAFGSTVISTLRVGLPRDLLKVRSNRKQFGRAVDSPKKRMNKFVLFAVKSKENKFFKSFFGANLLRANLLSVLSDLWFEERIDNN